LEKPTPEERNRPPCIKEKTLLLNSCPLYFKTVLSLLPAKGMSMWLVLFILGLIGAIMLFIHINLELNALGKGVDNLIAELKKHYGSQ
jgi:hypothetical protein